MTEGAPTIIYGEVVIHRFCAEDFLPPPLRYHIIDVLKLVLIDLVNNLHPLFKKKRREPCVK
jgi:hypothetical protein